jgi:SAM-dependent methyltransferase
MRWQVAGPDADLTWGVEVTGDAFVAKVQQYCASTPETSILEIGPGYGRLLKTMIRNDLPFGNYVGVDLSAQNCQWLRQNFGKPGISFINADAATVRLPGPFDLLISSLTLKHVYPTLQPVLANLAPQASPDSKFVFDLLEADVFGFVADSAQTWSGKIRLAVDPLANPSLSSAGTVRRCAYAAAGFLRLGRYGYFERDGTTYICRYAPRAVDAILKRTGLERVAYDQVYHDSRHRRLLVVAKHSH